MVRLEWADGTFDDPDPVLDAAEEQLARYFREPGHGFDLPLEPGGTAYQRAVWRAMVGIRSGAVMTYGQLARIAGGSPRSVGTACARNPLPLIVPCHRVTAAASLGGFSGGTGLETKQWLLRHENYDGADGPPCRTAGPRGDISGPPDYPPPPRHSSNFVRRYR